MWEKWFDKLICRLYQALGGSCEDLKGTPDDKARAVDIAYREGGPPEFPDKEARDEFLVLLDQLEICIEDPQATLSPVGKEILLTDINDLRQEIPP